MAGCWQGQKEASGMEPQASEDSGTVSLPIPALRETSQPQVHHLKISNGSTILGLKN